MVGAQGAQEITLGTKKLNFLPPLNPTLLHIILESNLTVLVISSQAKLSTLYY